MTQGLSIMEKPLSLSTTRRRLHPRKCVFVSFFCVTISSLLLFIIFWCTNIFQNAILSSLVVKNGPMLEWFIRPPIRAIYKIRIFNYTNVMDYESGKAKKLKVKETGPYIYRETLTRINNIFHSDGSISFQEKRSYQWEGGSPDDEIVVVPNVPLLASMATMRNAPFFAQLAFTGVLSTLQSKTFLTLPVNGLLWGYDDRIFEIAKPFIALQNEIPFDKFGLLAFKNGISSDVITINSGANDLSKINMIKLINGKKHKKVWNDKKCDSIYGTQGYIFPSDMFNRPNATLEVYSNEMCRTLYLHNTGTSSSFGIPSLTFKPPKDTFHYSPDNNYCYCPESVPGVESTRTCPPAGIFNSSACSFDMPFLASFPHFYTGDKILMEKIDGLNPQAELHESRLELHPRLGILIGGVSRIQLNIEARRAIGMPFHGGLDDGQILPLLWIELTIDDIPEPLLSSLKHGYYTAAAVETGIQWGSVIILILSSCLLMHVWRKQKKDLASTTTKHLFDNVGQENKVPDDSNNELPV
ncbi:scavenger receptor class B member 1-like [Microplitis mediator]|uniref:scavenger receptor class B member 1-like n=1 Tax=Microplitis mediator TaxID=375433 RepID=UPI002555E661|nr:scavenger receptor class B member 1-like [Microplitis mediator]